MKRTGEFRAGSMFSVRLNAEEAEEARWASRESGKPVSDLLRQGLRPVLAWVRAEWYEKHGSEDDWEEVAAEAGTRREMRSSFGVTLTGSQVLDIAQAAEACGVGISAYLREAGLALASAQRGGGTARCGHLSMSGVTGAECGTCGPLRVLLTVAAPGARPRTKGVTP
jgi:hypothetical protein